MQFIIRIFLIVCFSALFESDRPANYNNKRRHLAHQRKRDAFIQRDSPLTKHIGQFSNDAFLNLSPGHENVILLLP